MDNKEKDSIENKNERVCAVPGCNNSLEGFRKGAKVCLDKHVRKCVSCGKEMIVNRYDPTKDTCSQKCSYFKNTGYWNPSQNPEVKKKKEESLAKNFGDGDISKARKKVAAHQAKLYKERTGYINPGQNPEVKKKVKETVAKNFGDGDYDTAQQNLYRRRSGTYKERTGYINPGQNPEVRKKVKDTVNRKYGVDNVFQNKDIKGNIKKNLIERYGVDCNIKIPGVLDKIKKTNMEKYGVPYIVMLPEVRRSSGAISKLNLEWKKKLEDRFKMDVELEVPIDTSRSADLGIGGLLIDINPSFSHNSTISYSCLKGFCHKSDHSSCKTLKESYHSDRARIADKNGQILIQVFDWMPEDKVMDIIAAKLKVQSRRFQARATIVREISQKDANEFLDKYHLQGATKKQTVCLGLFDRGTDELLQVQTFGPSRFNKNFEWEAIRLVSKFDTFVVGGISKGWAYFVRNFEPESVISYGNLNIGHGGFDEQLGFRFENYTSPSCIWSNLNCFSDKKFVKDTTLVRLGIDRVLDRSVDSDGKPWPDYDGSFENSNEYLMLKEGFVRVFDSGSKVYSWHPVAS